MIPLTKLKFIFDHGTIMEKEWLLADIDRVFVRVQKGKTSTHLGLTRYKKSLKKSIVWEGIVRVFFLTLLICFFYAPFHVLASAIEEDYQKVIFLKVNSLHSLTFELPIKHPDVFLRDNISVRFNDINFKKGGNSCGTRANSTKGQVKRWIKNYLKGSKRIKVRRFDEGKFFEIIANGKSLEGELVKKFCPNLARERISLLHRIRGGSVKEIPPNALPTALLSRAEIM